jgi:hypothetical protein
MDLQVTEDVLKEVIEPLEDCVKKLNDAVVTMKTVAPEGIMLLKVEGVGASVAAVVDFAAGLTAALERTRLENRFGKGPKSIRQAKLIAKKAGIHDKGKR